MCVDIYMHICMYMHIFMYIFTYMCVDICQSMHEEVKGQLEGAVVLLYHMGSGIHLSASCLVARTF